MKYVGKDYVYLVIGDRCWGKGKTEKEAKKEAKKHGGSKALKAYDVYLADPTATVNGMGSSIDWDNKDAQLIHIKRVVDGKEVLA